MVPSMMLTTTDTPAPTAPGLAPTAPAMTLALSSLKAKTPTLFSAISRAPPAI